ncbi:hypothetical protein [Arenimonas metalli]|uniref:Transporter n=1 Tax=Arenimonas metalli CF5-1 TaxID=1384056 RepID=A0A091B2W8_9GAMM|nr:hypothetical protein [Arenimonas metalli]KFN45234.1 hypothetical protein N787_13270 [Arenimonas metalli CF5-1]
MLRTTLCAALALASVAVQAEDGASLSVGADYSSGEYGSDTTTDIFSVPVTAKWTTGAWTFKAGLPWLRIDGDPNVLPGVGSVVNDNPRGRGRGNGGAPDAPAEGSASGIGDLRLAATYAFDTGGPLGVDLTANVKFGTADEDKGLGTGATDYGLALDLYRDFDGTTLFGGVGYTVLGDSDFIDVDSVVGANVGASRTLGPGSLGLSYEWREAASDGFDDRSELMAFYSVRTDGGSRWQVYALAGLSDGSPDIGAGFSYTIAY